MKQIILLHIFLGFLVTAYAQHNQIMEIKNYLPEYPITNIDDAGDYLWLSTDQEVIKFEKATGQAIHYGFEDIDMSPDFSILVVKCDKNGLPWVGAEFTGTLKMTKDEKWILLPPVSSEEFERSTYEILFTKDGTTWTSTINVLTSYQGDTIVRYTTNGSITSLSSDNEGNIWLGTANYLAGHNDGLVKFDGKNWTIFNSSPTGIWPPLAFAHIIIEDKGTIWMSGYLGMENPYTYLIEFDGINWKIYKPNPAFKLPFYIQDIVIDEAGLKWIGTNQGLIIFNGTNWITFDESNSGLPSDNICSILIDDNDTKWLGTGQGLVSFSEVQIETSVKKHSRLESGIVVYPNPTKDYITIKMPEGLNGSVAEILNLQGKSLKIFNAENAPFRLDVSHFPRGVYMIRIQANHNYLLTRFIKQ